MPSAAVDLPQPDSPTSPYDAPALDRERDAAEHRPVDPAHAVGELEIGDLEGAARRRLRSSLVRLADAVGDEVDRDDEARDRERGEERHPPVGIDERVVLVDLRRPVGRGRRDAEAEERRASRSAKIAYPSRTVNSTTTSDMTFGRISENMMYWRALAAQPGRLHVVELAPRRARPPGRCAR